MDSKRAADYLRDARAGNRELREAEEMGARALEAWAWVERTGCSVRPFGTLWAASFVSTVNGHRMYMSSSETTPLTAVMDAMRKERNDGPK
jgi:hypothetical protein